MIVDLPSTTTANISKRLVLLREDNGAMALSRVLTLVIVVDELDIDDAVGVANDASRQHPCRIIVLAQANRRGSARLDGQIRIGGDAGASEVVVLRMYGPLASHGLSVVTPLLLADSPIVVWWPSSVPKDPGADPIGAMAQRRITDSTQSGAPPRSVLRRLASAYRDGDTDLAWSRITLWRGVLAAALDQAPYEQVTEASVVGGSDSPSADLLAGWLAQALRCPVNLIRARGGSGVVSVRLERKNGVLDLVRPKDGNVAILSQTGRPDRTIALAHRTDAQCLADELRRLDPDEVYHETLTRGIERVTVRRQTMSEAVRQGEARSPADAARDVRRLRREAVRARRQRGSMVELPTIPPRSAESEPGAT